MIINRRVHDLRPEMIGEVPNFGFILKWSLDSLHCYAGNLLDEQRLGVAFVMAAFLLIHT